MIDGELETGDLDLVSDALHLLDALVSDHNQESGGKPLGADSGALAAAVRAVLECSKICSDAGGCDRGPHPYAAPPWPG